MLTYDDTIRVHILVHTVCTSDFCRLQYQHNLQKSLVHTVITKKIIDLCSMQLVKRCEIFLAIILNYELVIWDNK